MKKYVLYQSEQAKLSAETKDPGLLLMARRIDLLPTLHDC